MKVKDTFAGYDLEISRVIEKIKSLDSRRVLLQFPDGLKPYSGQIADRIEKETKAMPIVWAQTNFGACDVPLGLKHLKIDLVVAFGHNAFYKLEEW